MDATKTHLNRIAFIFLTLALGIAAPWSAQAQTFSSPAYGPIQLAVPSGSSVTVAGTGDSAGNVITFTASSINYTDGSRPWLEVGSDISCAGGHPTTYTTPATVTMIDGCYAYGLSTGSHTAIVTLTDAYNARDTATITVIITIGSGSGGTGTITAYSSSCGASCASASASVGGSSSATVTLSTSSNASISYSTIANPASWLTVSNYSGAVSASSPTTLYLSFNAAGITTPQTLVTTIYVYYNGTSSSVPIGVTFYVGTSGNTGTLTLSQSTVGWSYATGGSLPSPSVVYIQNSTAAYYGLILAGSPLFLTGNGYSVSTGNTAFPFATYGTGVTIAPNNAVINSALSTGTYYNYVTVTDSNGRTAMLTVELTVNSASGGIINISPNPIALNGIYLGGAVSSTVSITSTVSGNLTAYITTEDMTLSTVPTSITAGVPVYLTVYGSPGGLSPGAYTGFLNVTVAPTSGSGSSSSLSVPATFTVSGGGGGNGTSGATVAPSTFQFNYEQGTNTVEPQTLSINGTTGGSDTYTISSPSATWLQTGSSQGSAPATIQIFVNPTSLTPGAYSAYFTVTTTIAGYTSAVQVTVNTQVAASGVPVLVVQTTDGGSINLSHTGGSANPAAQTLYLSASDNSAQAFTATASVGWITLGASTGTTPGGLSASINASGLPNGLNSGNITITGSFGTAVVPVVVYVTGSSITSTGVLTLSASALTFNAVYASTVPSYQTLSVSDAATTSFTASASGTYGGITWLSVSPAGNLQTNQTLTVSVNQSTLPIGTYTGYIYLTTSSGTQTVTVTLNVAATSTTALTVSATSVAFSYTTGGSSPGSQTISVTSGSTAIDFTIADSVTSGNWLILTTTAGNAITSGTSEVTGFTIVVNANPAGLGPGTYTGTITLTPASGGTLSIPVSLTVTSGSTVSVAQSTLSFSYQAGGSNPAAQSLSVSGAGGAVLAFTATAISTGNWLTVTPTSGNTPATLAVTVAPSSLTAAGSPYTGTIVVAGSGSASGSNTITVTLAVTAPLPTITAVVNGASFAGGKIAPGEIVTLGGTNLGPVNALGLTLNSAGQVSTSLGNVSVSFNGYLAPLIYVSATQINCVVPYEVAKLISPFVQVTYAGQTSNAYPLSATATAPGIFTLNGQGSGPGAVLNASGSVNGSNSPAVKGGTIVIFMTGEGQTGPAGVTGSVTAVNTSGVGPLTPQPLLPVAVTIGGQPATVSFYGEAPGLVAGVMQVNVIVPAAASSGIPNALVVSVGGNPSQTGVTVAVQ
jgi:uncharacterized protein (TIGR03437 family)